MSESQISLNVAKDIIPVTLQEAATSLTISVVSGATVTVWDNQDLQNPSTIVLNASATFTQNVWVQSASFSSITVKWTASSVSFANAVTVQGGGSPGALGWGTFPIEADYIVRGVGGGVGAVNMKTGNTDFSVSSGDGAPVIQSALNAIAGDLGKAGGKVSIAGHINLASQIVVQTGLHLSGAGVVADTSPSTQAVLSSSYNGPIILVTDSSQANSQAFVTLSDLTIFGNNGALQNGVQWDNSAGMRRRTHSFIACGFRTSVRTATPSRVVAPATSSRCGWIIVTARTLAATAFIRTACIHGCEL